MVRISSSGEIDQILTTATVLSDSNPPDELILTLWICNWPEWRYAAAATGRELIAKVPLAVSPRIISFPITSIAKYQVVTWRNSLTQLGCEQHLPCPYSWKGGASSSQSFSQLLNILRLCCWNNELSFQVRLRLSELWNCLKLHKLNIIIGGSWAILKASIS